MRVKPDLDNQRASFSALIDTVDWGVGRGEYVQGGNVRLPLIGSSKCRVRRQVFTHLTRVCFLVGIVDIRISFL